VNDTPNTGSSTSPKTGLKILFVTPEVHPLIKVGGLGDISNALPAALRQLGADARLLIPGYPAVLEMLDLKLTLTTVELFAGTGWARILSGIMPDGETPVLVVDSPSLYDRAGGPYQDQAGHDWPDNHLRFGALCKAAVRLSRANDLFHPDVIHCNDWPTGLIPAYLHYSQQDDRPPTVMSIHNMAFQGLFPRDTLAPLGLPKESFTVYGLEFNNQVSFLKSGLYYADWLSTVSPAYAEEIQTPAFGYGMQGLLGERRNQLTGILNGIDTREWNPEADRHLPVPFSAANLSGKAQNKQALRKKLGLAADNPNVPLIGLVSRLTYQKGYDLLVPIIPDIMREGAQLVVLGIGEENIEAPLQRLAQEYPEQLSFTLGYDESLAHQIEAAADIFLMPSRFEPSGLNQMYSMRYGTVPIVRRTGGLADSVVDTSPATLDDGSATGFTFEEAKPEQLLHCIRRALLTFRDKKTWKQIQKNGMSRDFSWQHSAQAYLDLYRRLI
jgi:starch synthase